LITSDHYFYNGKKINILEKIEDILKKIPSIKKTLVFAYNKNEEINIQDYINFDQVLESDGSR
jgi:acetoacetyl-CoA synthetase